MWGQCLSNDPASLPGHQRAHWDVLPYRLTPGRDYPVVGMVLYLGKLLVLTSDDEGTPSFIPAGLLSIGASELPPGWMFEVRPGIRLDGPELDEHPELAVWGYPQFVQNPSIGAALMEESEPTAVREFERQVLRERANPARRPAVREVPSVEQLHSLPAQVEVQKDSTVVTAWANSGAEVSLQWGQMGARLRWVQQAQEVLLSDWDDFSSIQCDAVESETVRFVVLAPAGSGLSRTTVVIGPGVNVSTELASG